VGNSTLYPQPLNHSIPELNNLLKKIIKILTPPNILLSKNLIPSSQTNIFLLLNRQYINIFYHLVTQIKIFNLSTTNYIITLTLKKRKAKRKINNDNLFYILLIKYIKMILFLLIFIFKAINLSLYK